MDLAPVYGLSLQGCNGELPIGEFFSQKMGGKPVLGDHLEWQGFVWSAAEMDHGRILKIGLKVAQP